MPASCQPHKASSSSPPSYRRAGQRAQHSRRPLISVDSTAANLDCTSDNFHPAPPGGDSQQKGRPAALLPKHRSGSSLQQTTRRVPSFQRAQNFRHKRARTGIRYSPTSGPVAPIIPSSTSSRVAGSPSERLGGQSGTEYCSRSSTAVRQSEQQRSVFPSNLSNRFGRTSPSSSSSVRPSTDSHRTLPPTHYSSLMENNQSGHDHNPTQSESPETTAVSTSPRPERDNREKSSICPTNTRRCASPPTSPPPLPLPDDHARHSSSQTTLPPASGQNVSSSVASALVTLEDFFAAAFGAASRPSRQPGTSNWSNETPSDVTSERPGGGSSSSTRFTRMVDGFIAECLVDGVGSIWKARVAALESNDPHRQAAALSELTEWLTYMTSTDSLRGVPTERLTLALVDIIAGRLSKRHNHRSRRRRRPEKASRAPSASDEEGWMHVNSQEATTGTLHSDKHRQRWMEENGDDEETSSLSNEESCHETCREAPVPSDLDGEDATTSASRRLAAAECLQHLLDCNPVAARCFVASDGVDVLTQQLGCIEYIDLAEKIVSCLQTLATEIPARLLSAGAIGAMLEIIEFFPLSVQQSIAVTVATLLIYVRTKADHRVHVQPCLPQLVSLLNHEDDHLLRWTTLGIRRVLETVSHEEDPALTAEVLDTLSKHGLHTTLVKSLKEFIKGTVPGVEKPSASNRTTHSRTKVLSSDRYLMALDSMYILSVCCFHSQTAALELLDAGIFQVITEYLQFQTMPGQDAVLTSYIISCISSLLPEMRLEPRETTLKTTGGGRSVSLLQLSSSRVELFGGRRHHLEYLCSVVVPLLLESSYAPASRQSVQTMFLTLCLSLTTLLRELGGSLTGILINSLNRQHFFALIASTLVRLQTHPQESVMAAHSHTSVFAGLSIASNLLDMDCERLAVEFHRQGILKRMLLLAEPQSGQLVTSCSTAKRGHRRPSIGTKRCVWFTSDALIDALKTEGVKSLVAAESALWQAICHQFQEGVQEDMPILLNISTLIRWTACRTAVTCLNGLPNYKASELFKKHEAFYRLFSHIHRAHGAPTSQDSAMLQEFRRYLLEGFSCDKGISSFEFSEYEGAEALCRYLFGGVVSTEGIAETAAAAGASSESSSPAQTLTHVHTKRLLLLIREFGVPKFKNVGSCASTAEAGGRCCSWMTEWPKNGIFPVGLDLRPLLCFSRLLVGCIEQCERLLPLEALTAVQSPMDSPPSRNSDHAAMGGIWSTPRHLQPSLSSRSLLAVAENQRGLRDLLHPNWCLTTAGRRRFDRCLASFYSPQNLFDFMATELKLNATVTVGDVVSCELSLPGWTNADLDAADAKHSRLVSTLAEELRQAFETTASDTPLSKLTLLSVRCPTERNELQMPSLENSDGRPAGITLMLQLCVDIRTPAAMLHQSLVQHIEKQVHWLRQKMLREQQTPHNKQDDREDKIRIRGASLDDLSCDGTAQSGASDRVLSTSINGHMIPSHMTIAEALCRFGNCVLAPREGGSIASFFDTESQRLTLGRRQTSTSKSSSEPMVTTNSDDSPMYNEVSTLLREGSWLLFGKRGRFVVMAPQEEQLRMIKFVPVAGRAEHGVGCEGAAVAAGLSEQRRSEGRRRATRYKPLWGVDHTMTANLSSRAETIESLEADLQRYETLKPYYIVMEEVQADDDSAACLLPSASQDQRHRVICVSTEKDCPQGHSFPSSGFSVQVFPPMTRDVDGDGVTKLQPDGSRWISLGHLLAHLHLRKLCQTLGLPRFPQFEALEKPVEGGLFQLQTTATPLPSETSSTKSPLVAFQQLITALRQWDVYGSTSPIVCHTVHFQFSHAGLYAKLLEDVVRFQKECHHSSTSERLSCRYPCDVLVAVNDAMLYLRGGKTSAYHSDVLMQAGCTDLLGPLGSFMTHCEQQEQQQTTEDHVQGPNQQRRPCREQEPLHRKSLSVGIGVLTSADCEVIANVSDDVGDVDAEDDEEEDDDDEEGDEDDEEGDEDDNEDDDCCDEDDIGEVRYGDDENDDDEEDDGNGDDDFGDEEEEDDDNDGIAMTNEAHTSGAVLSSDHQQQLTPVETLMATDPDIFQGHEKLASFFQLTLLVFRLIEVLWSSNRALAETNPSEFLTDIQSSTSPELDPLYFPTSSQLRCAQLSQVLTAKARQQLSDPIAIASMKVPRWVTALTAVAPSLFSLPTRRLLHTSTAKGSLAAIMDFADRLKRDVEILGALSLPNTRRPHLSVQAPLQTQEDPEEAFRRPGLPVSRNDDVGCGGLTLDDSAEDEGFDRPDLSLVTMGQAVYRLSDGNRRRQWRRAVDLRQILTPQRTKIRLVRDHVLASATKVLDFFHINAMTTSLPATMEIEYMGEEGTGSGPTLEFYSEVLDQLIVMASPQLFRTSRPQGFLFPQPYAVTPMHVLPQQLRRPQLPALASAPSVGGCSSSGSTTRRTADSVTSAWSSSSSSSASTSSSLESLLFGHFKLMGQLYAKALLDGRLIDLPLHPLFWKLVLLPAEHWPSLANEAMLSFVDPALAKQLHHLRQLRDSGESLSNLALAFVLPGSNPEIPLVQPSLDDGRSDEQSPDTTPFVTEDNLEEFIDLCCQWSLLRGIALQVWAFRFGVATFLPLQSLRYFLPSELAGAVTGCLSAIDREEYWSLNHLQQAIIPDHGYTTESPVFQQFLEVMSELTKPQRRAFLKFCTGTSILPRGGFLALRPGMKVVKKGDASTSPSHAAEPSATDSLLPSVMACTNYVKLPSYSSKEKLRQKLLLALEEGQGAFMLS